MMHAYAYTHIM